jgi:hypothetical protein
MDGACDELYNPQMGKESRRRKPPDLCLKRAKMVVYDHAGLWLDAAGGVVFRVTSNGGTMMRAILILTLAALPAHAEAVEEFGTLNPEEMTIARILDDVARGETSMMTCAAGYGITKKGDHDHARDVFEACARDGWTGAMTWMSRMDDNGLGIDGEDPEGAANWDRMAAEAGDPVGMFNYGLDLMRGRGVSADEGAGRALVDRAAEAGLPVAQRLQAAGYDLDEVTPDADNWKYDRQLY